MPKALFSVHFSSLMYGFDCCAYISTKFYCHFIVTSIFFISDFSTGFTPLHFDFYVFQHSDFIHAIIQYFCFLHFPTHKSKKPAEDFLLPIHRIFILLYFIIQDVLKTLHNSPNLLEYKKLQIQSLLNHIYISQPLLPLLLQQYEANCKMLHNQTLPE